MEGTRSLVRICFSCSDEHRGKNGIDGIAAGGARRDRTDDLLLAKQALSQLSYGPDRGCGSITKDARENVVGLGRFELPTSRLSSARSNQLSYRPNSTVRTLHPRASRDGGHEGCAIDLGIAWARPKKKEKRRRRSPAKRT